MKRTLTDGLLVLRPDGSRGLLLMVVLGLIQGYVDADLIAFGAVPVHLSCVLPVSYKQKLHATLKLKYHHFRTHFEDGMIRINTIGTKDKVADIFAKVLDAETYSSLYYANYCQDGII